MEEAIFVLRRIFTVISIVTFIAVIILATFKVRQLLFIWRVVMEDEPGYSKTKAMKEWENIQRSLDSDDRYALQLAITEADKLVDRILIKSQFEGKTMDDRLRMAYRKGKPSVEELWRAHKTREYVEQKQGTTDPVLARQTVNRIERVLKEWDVL